MGINILGSGSSHPKKQVFNDDFTNIETSDEWIYSRTGIKSRFFCEDETTYTLALDASKKALGNAKINKDDIGLVIVATMTPDCFTPALSSRMLDELGIKNAMAFDINVACSGFVYALNVAYHMLEGDKLCLVVGAEALSNIIDFNDRSTCVLFGDGAGALIFKKNEKDVLFYAKSKTDTNQILGSLGLGNLDKDYFLKMKGQEVFRFAIDSFKDSLTNLEKSINLNEIDLIIPHQANKRIIETISRKYDIDINKFYLNLDKYGNTSAASIAIALDEALNDGTIKPNMKVLLIGFGSGLSWGYTLIEI